MSFAIDLWQANQDLALACLNNPFVQGIATGTLPKSCFAYYVGQDAFFLDSFARAYSICAAKAPTLDDFVFFHRLATGVLEERHLHQGYAAQWGIELQTIQPGVTTRRYVDFLVATAWSQGIGVTAAAMAPCMRLYAYLGQTLAQQPPSPNPDYQNWIETYSQPFFADLAQQLETLLDRHHLGQTKDAATLAYRYAMQCEFDFFQAAWEVMATR